MHKRAVFTQDVTVFWAVELPDLPENTPDEVVRVLAEALYMGDPYLVDDLPDDWRAFAKGYYRQHENDGLKRLDEQASGAGSLDRIEEV